MEAARDAMLEAEAAALASIGQRGTYAKKLARAAMKTRQERRWEAITARVSMSAYVAEPQELAASIPNASLGSTAGEEDA